MRKTYWGWWREGRDIVEKMYLGVVGPVVMLLLAVMSPAIMISLGLSRGVGTASSNPLLPGVLGLGVIIYGASGTLAVSFGTLWGGVVFFLITAGLLFTLVSHATNLREQCSTEDDSD